ncbi:MAG: hypothetical protein GF421_01505 [Candidatus Aminicenantes bacterium]|nr:hypothetical protein [Candidatus Aminicenantes bacterium]
MNPKTILRISAIFCLTLTIFIPGRPYYEKVHSFAAKLALQLLEKSDRNRLLYREIYSPAHMRAIGMGAWMEDYGVVRGIDRSFRHYYDPDAKGPRKGVPYYLYYHFWRIEGAAVKRPKHSAYEGALEWARRGTDRSGRWSTENPFNWEGAIRAYDYTSSSRLEAYQRLGHVVHLLVDMSEPDHAGNVPHGGSGFKLPESIDEMFGDKVIEKIKNSTLSEEKKLLLAQTVILASIKMKSMLAKGDPNLRTIGFEGLIEDTIPPEIVGEFFPGKYAKYNKPSEGFLPHAAPIEVSQVRRMKTLDHYFNSLAYESKKAVKDKKQYPLALGCMDLFDHLRVSNRTWLVNYMKRPILTQVETLQKEAVEYFGTKGQLYIVPIIDRNNKSELQRFYTLAKDLLGTAIETSAGLMEHFHDLVNPPPYIKSVKITQGRNIVYDAYWKDTVTPRGGTTKSSPANLSYSTVPNRVLIKKSNASLEPDKDATIIIEFGPNCADYPEPIDPKSISVSIGPNSATGRLQQTEKSTTWTGGFRVASSILGTEKSITISVQAKDSHIHFDPKTRSFVRGFDLDADPKNPAKLWCKGINGYVWNNYKRGIDSNHKISLKELSLDIEETPKAQEEKPSGAEIPEEGKPIQNSEVFYLRPNVSKDMVGSNYFLVFHTPVWQKKNSCVTIFYIKEELQDSKNPELSYIYESTANLNTNRISGNGVYPHNPKENWKFQNSKWDPWWVCCDNFLGTSSSLKNLETNELVYDSAIYKATVLAKDDEGKIYRADTYFDPSEWEVSSERGALGNHQCYRKDKKRKD